MNSFMNRWTKVIGGWIVAMSVVGCEPPAPIVVDKSPKDSLSKKDDRGSKGNQPSNDPSAESQKVDKPNEPSIKVEDVHSNWITSRDLPSEHWELIYARNTPIGFNHLRMKEVESVAAKSIECIHESRLKLKKGNTLTQQTLKVETTEYFDGELRTFKIEYAIGDQATKIQGKAVSNVLQYEIEREGKKENKALPWSKEHRGPFAIEQSLRRKSLEPDEVRIVHYLDPVMLTVVEARLQSRGKITTPLLDGTLAELTEVEVQTKYGDQSVKTLYWVDEHGQSLKSYITYLDMRTFRGTRAAAENLQEQGALDLATLSHLFLKDKVEGIQNAKSVRYRVKLSGADPLEIFSRKTNQKIESISNREAIITVMRPELNEPLPPGIDAEQGAAEKYLAKTPEMAWDDPAIQELLKEGLKQARAGESEIQTLTRFVFEKVEKRVFSRGVSSASDVAKSLQGDCTEHAILLATLARARKIPSRLALGMIYGEHEGKPCLSYHMWVELWKDDRWIGVDPTRNQVLVPPDRMKITETGWENGTASLSLLDVFRTMGQMAVEVQLGE